MSHLKRQKVPKSWPIERKGTAYVVKPTSNLEESVPILIALRDMLKLSQNRKEVKNAIHNKAILINSKLARDDKNILSLFDILTIIPIKKSYRLVLSERGKFEFEEVKENEARKKIVKITNKKTLKGKKAQLNLSGVYNFISGIKCNVGDSVLIDLQNRKIEKCLPLKEKEKVIIFAGKHSGKSGVIEKLKLEKKMAKINSEDGPINVLIKQIMVVE